MVTTREERFRLLVRSEGADEETVQALAREAGVDAAEIARWRTRVLDTLEAVGEPEVEVRLFGPPEIVAARRALWSQRRPLELVAHLASARDRRATRRAIAENLWPGAPDRSVARNFHPTVSLARRALRDAGLEGDPIPAREGTWGLSEDVRWRVDVDRYRDLAKRGRSSADPEERAARLAAAWKLRSGPFLDGWSAPWIEARRQALDREHRELLLALGDAQRASGRRGEALDTYRSLLILDPLAEPVHLEVMAIHAETGRRDLVRRQFLRLQESLAEMEMEPSRETRSHVLTLLEA